MRGNVEEPLLPSPLSPPQSLLWQQAACVVLCIQTEEQKNVKTFLCFLAVLWISLLAATARSPKCEKKEKKIA